MMGRVGLGTSKDTELGSSVQSLQQGYSKGASRRSSTSVLVTMAPPDLEVMYVDYTNVEEHIYIIRMYVRKLKQAKLKYADVSVIGS